MARASVVDSSAGSLVSGRGLLGSDGGWLSVSYPRTASVVRRYEATSPLSVLGPPSLSKSLCEAWPVLHLCELAGHHPHPHARLPA